MSEEVPTEKGIVTGRPLERPSPGKLKAGLGKKEAWILSSCLLKDIASVGLQLLGRNSGAAAERVDGNGRTCVRIADERVDVIEGENLREGDSKPGGGTGEVVAQCSESFVGAGVCWQPHIAAGDLQVQSRDSDFPRTAR